MADENEYVEDSGEGQGDQPETVTLTKAEYEQQLRQANASGQSEALGLLRQMQSAGGDADDGDEDGDADGDATNYDPAEMRRGATEEVLTITSAMDEMVESLREEFPALDSKALARVKNDVITATRGSTKALGMILRNKVHVELAERELGRLLRQGKITSNKPPLPVRGGGGGAPDNGGTSKAAVLKEVQRLYPKLSPEAHARIAEATLSE